MKSPIGEETALRIMACLQEADSPGHPAPEESSNSGEAEVRPDETRVTPFAELLEQLWNAVQEGDEGATISDVPFGRFRLKRVLGQGGFGVVFLAEDPLLGRDVALKLPQPTAWFSKDYRQRFLREARAAAGLDHPNIVPIFDAGEIAGLGYIASAFCSGPTLATWLEARPEAVDPRVAAAWTAQLAEAVRQAHGRGILHRDIKPANILLEPQPDAPGGFVPKLADFGLARIVADERDTRSKVILGTPRYMSPEQATGSVAEIGPATDIFGLGVLLYELLARIGPFDGVNDSDTLRRVIEVDPVSPRRLCGNIDQDLESICLRCLEKRPKDRYLTAASLAEDLRRYLAGLPVAARPISSMARVIRWGRRRPLQAALSFGLIATLIVGFSLITWQWRRAKEHLVRAQHRSELLVSLLNSHFLQTNAWNVPYESLMESRLETRSRLRERMREVLETGIEPERPSLDLAMALSHLATLEWEADLKEESVITQRRATELYLKLMDGYPSDAIVQHNYLKSVVRLGSHLAVLGQVGEAERLLGIAAQLAEPLNGVDPGIQFVWNTWNGGQKYLQRHLWMQRRFAEHANAVESVKHRFHQLRSKYPTDPFYDKELLEYLKYVACNSDPQINAPEWLQYLREAAEVGETWISTDPEASMPRICLVDVHSRICRRLIEGNESILVQHSEVMAAVNNAKRHLDKLLDNRYLDPKESVSLVIAMSHLAGTYVCLRNHHASLDVASNAVRIAENLLAADPENVPARRELAMIGLAMGRSQLGLRRHDEAYRSFDMSRRNWVVLAKSITLNYKDLYPFGETHYELSKIQRRQRKFDEEKQSLTQAVALYESCLGTNKRVKECNERIEECRSRLNEIQLSLSMNDGVSN